MQLKSKINHNAVDYFRRHIQVPSTNLQDSNMSFPYKHEFFHGLNKLPFLSSEPEIVSFPMKQENIHEFNTALHESTNSLQINMVPRHNTGFSTDSIEVGGMLEEQLIKNHISLDDLALIDEETISIYNGTMENELEAETKSIRKENDSIESCDVGVKLLHPFKPNVTAVSVMDVVPLDINYCSTFQVMLDSKDENVDTILELHEGWRYPSTRFSFYSKADNMLYKHDRDFSSTLPRDYTKSYIVSLPRSFIEHNKCSEQSRATDSKAYIISTKSPKLLLSRVSSVKRKPKIKLL
ncbi:hypothetical protein OJ253_2248 [Cryptosporidium canis]|uniref:Uncharacterized protein n=1 Tax=Cryptosporidium canis TaxID=195482 RepID=A0A9D5DHW9_9CRYT|nr:hypothetical protein OJ253_2248 [Cryptosporidium canis]